MTAVRRRVQALEDPARNPYDSTPADDAQRLVEEALDELDETESFPLECPEASRL